MGLFVAVQGDLSCSGLLARAPRISIADVSQARSLKRIREVVFSSGVQADSLPKAFACHLQVCSMREIMHAYLHCPP